jgi:adenylate kinase
MAHLRLQTYHRAISPIVNYYQASNRLVIIDSQGDIDAIDKALFDTVEAVQRHETRRATPEEVAQLQARKKPTSAPLTDAVIQPSYDLIFLGAPGAGKGTQAAQVSRVYGVPRIATGDLFRENIRNETDLGLMAKSYMDHGKLVPDEVTEAMVRDRLSQPDVEAGFILDGFPRNLPQAEALTDMMVGMKRRLAGVIYLRVSDAEIVRRLSGRMICRQCQLPFHKEFNPFQSCPNGKCEGEHLYQRSDDAPETVRKRLRTFHGETETLVDYYCEAGLLIEIDGEGDLADIRKRIMAAAAQLQGAAAALE